jgi:NAD(P)-dependent dehydrogenase (short-subunit alcohol dehydrogenase family)
MAANRTRHRRNPDGGADEPASGSILNSKVIVITGGSGGIGAALGDAVSLRGASVALVARREKELRNVAERCGSNAMPIVADVSKREDVQYVAREALGHFGHVDVWVNNVGQGITRLPSELTDDDIDRVMQVNVKSALYGMQAILPHFKERGEGQIVNVSSMLGRIPSKAFRSAYNGAKHFLNALTANFRTEYAETHPGIVFSLVSPGVVRTDFGVSAMYGGPDSRQVAESQSPEEAALVIVDVIESRRVDVYTFAGARQRVIEYYSTIGEDP